MNHKALNFDYNEYSKSILGSYVHNSAYKKSVELSGLKNGDVVLDFGAGKGFLKKFLPKGIDYIAYDIEADLTDYEHYTDVEKKVDVVIANFVFDHMTTKELEEFLCWCETKGVKKIVVSLAMNNELLNTIRFLFGNYFVTQVHHITTWQQISRLMSKHFTNTKVVSTSFFNWILLWENRGENTR